MAELINQFIDRNSAKSQFDWVVTELGQIEKVMDDINKKGIKLELSVKDADSMDGLIQSTNELQAANKALLESSKQLEAQQKLLRPAKKQQQQQDKDDKKNLDNYLASVKKGQDELNKLGKQFETLATAKKKDADTSKKYEKIQNDTDRQIKKLQRTLEFMTRQHEKNQAAIEKEIASVQKQQQAYNVLDSVHKKLLIDARNVGAEFGVESKQFEEAARKANAFGKQLYEIDRRLGEHRRNIGNYASAYNGLSYTVGNLVSELPNLAQNTEIFFRAISNNILPLYQQLTQLREENARLVASGQKGQSVWKQFAASLFSVQTALVVGVTLLVAYHKEIIALITGTKNLVNAQTALTSIYDTIDTSFAKTGVELESLNKKFHESTTTIKEKDLIVKQLNKEYGKVAGSITTWADAERFFIEQAPAYVEAMKQRAIADAAYQLMAKNSIELLKEENKTASEAASGWDMFVAGISAAFKPGALLFGQVGKAYDEALLRGTKFSAGAIRQIEDNRMRLNKESTQLQRLAEDAEELFTKITAAAGLDFSETKAPKVPNALDTTGLRKSIMDGINAANEERAKAALETEKKLAKSIIDNDRSTGEERLAAQWRYTTAAIALTEIEKKKEIEANNILNQANMARIEREKVSEKDAQELRILEKERYDKTYLALTEKYLEEQKQLLIEYSKEAAELLDKNINQEIVKSVTRSMSIISKFFDDFKNKGKTDLEELVAGVKLMKEIIESLAEIGSNVAESIFAPQIAEQDAILNRIERQKDLDIARIKATYATEQEEQEALLAYEQQYDIARRQAETERLKLKRQQAQVDKATGMMNIIVKTGEAVITAWTEGDAYTKALRAGLAAAVGASQLAVAAAAPLPQFYKGTESSPETWAWTGEKGRELRINPDGSMGLTPSTATLSYLEKGTKIIPNRETEELLQHAEMKTAGEFFNPSEKERIGALMARAYAIETRRSTDRIVKAIADNKTAPKKPIMDNFFDRHKDKYKR